jgi:ribonuclease HI
VDKFAGARFKSFPTRAEAEHAFKAGSPRPASRKTSAPRAPSVKSRAITGDSPGDAEQDMPSGSKPDIQIFCDGACEPNPGHAGSGIAVYRNGSVSQLWYGLHNPNGTNNTAELNALYHALLIAEQAMQAGQTAEVLSDSMYSINCIATWATGWERRGWRKAGGEIKNLEIIKTTYALYNRIKQAIRLTHVSAHVGTQGNELADRMAMLGVQSREASLCLYAQEIDIPLILRMRAG